MSAAASRFSPGTVTVAVDGLAVDGTVHAADPTLGLLIFELSEPAETAPAAGSVVRILRGGPGGAGAQAELIEVEDEQRWVDAIRTNMQQSSTLKQRYNLAPADDATIASPTSSPLR